MKKKLQKKLSVFLGVCIALLVVLGALQITSEITHYSWEHWRPNYAKIDIAPLLDKSELTDSDYQTLYAQTGLTKLGIDDLLKADRKDRILKIQDFYFDDVETDCRAFAPFTYIEQMDSFGYYGALQEGDVIVSATTHSVFLRVGHASIIVKGNVIGNDATMAESVGIGAISNTVRASTGADLANYMVLRPTKIPETDRKKVAEYAEKSMQGLEYDFTIGIFSKKFPDKPTKTNCAHLCWYPFMKMGYDVDSNGGLTVKPQDIANSEYMEVVQIYGFHPEKLWK